MLLKSFTLFFITAGNFRESISLLIRLWTCFPIVKSFSIMPSSESKNSSSNCITILVPEILE